MTHTQTEAAVYFDVGSGDVFRAVGSEKQRRANQVFGHASTAEGHFVSRLFASLRCVVKTTHGRVNRAGHDAVYRDAEFSEFEGE